MLSPFLFIWAKEYQFMRKNARQTHFMSLDTVNRMNKISYLVDMSMIISSVSYTHLTLPTSDLV